MVSKFWCLEIVLVYFSRVRDFVSKSGKIGGKNLNCEHRDLEKFFVLTNYISFSSASNSIPRIYHFELKRLYSQYKKYQNFKENKKSQPQCDSNKQAQPHSNYLSAVVFDFLRFDTKFKTFRLYISASLQIR